MGRASKRFLEYGIFILLGVLILGLVYINRERVSEGFEEPGYKLPAPPSDVSGSKPPMEKPAQPPAAPKRGPIPVIKDVWVINLDRSKDRWNTMIEETANLDPLPVNRWSAIDGRTLTEQDFIQEKIPIIVRPQNSVDFRKERRKGEIGCYLSHKKLLENLGKMTKVSDMSGHLILEDDVKIDRNTLDKWIEVAPGLNKDWDIFFFGIHDPGLEKVSNGIAKVKSIQSLHAYMVKHSSIPKILKIIDVMYDPIDEIIRWNADKLNMYAIQPFTITQRANYHSDIQGKVT
jgi:hypothetical protein